MACSERQSICESRISHRLNPAQVENSDEVRDEESGSSKRSQLDRIAWTGPPLWNQGPAQEPWLYTDGSPHPQLRHWSKYRYLQRDLWSAAQAAALSRRASVGVRASTGAPRTH